MIKKLSVIILTAIILILSNKLYAEEKIIKLYEEPYMFLPDQNNKNNASQLNEILTRIKSDFGNENKLIIELKKGRYDFYPDDAVQKEYYISNHDQNQPKYIGICLEDWHDITIDANGAEFIFHGQMLPIAVVASSNITLENFSIDFENPHIAQVEILKNDENQGITFRVEPWVKYRINENNHFEAYGDNWKYQQQTGIAFDKKTHHILYNTGDLWIDTKDVTEISDHVIHAPNWKDNRLKKGTIVAMRTWYRPAPAIFLDHCNNTTVKSINVHYAEGMGLLAQRCTDIELYKFNVCLKENSKRYFTTQADATHFSQCKGLIRSEYGLYEGMMDDAINVHGIYLKVKERIDDNSLICRYEHNQAWGFAWGDAGDSVCFIKSKSMEYLNHHNVIKDIKPHENNNIKGCKEFIISFENKLSEEIQGDIPMGIENLTWVPEVIFSNNIVRNNRARGALFSSPLKTICEGNIFDHTSGTAILLCGDCNGWYESGACKDVVIRNNTFINALTSMYQFTNAVISIYPEIPELEKQQNFFHSGIVIENNVFETFDMPILYAKSVNGLKFNNNTIRKNKDYRPLHKNENIFWFERVNNIEIK